MSPSRIPLSTPWSDCPKYPQPNSPKTLHFGAKIDDEDYDDNDDDDDDDSLTGPAVLWRSLVCSLNEHDRTVASEAQFCF